MAYLEPADYTNYGLPAGTTADWIAAATALINSYCRRPDLNVIQYAERLRVVSGAHTVRLSYLPLAPLAPATSPIVSLEGRYAKPRRGEVLHEPLFEIAWAFSLPGQWASIDATLVDFDPSTGELSLPWNVLGLPYNEVQAVYTAGSGGDRRRREVGVRADRAQCAGHAGAEREHEQDRHHADEVFLKFADRRDGAGVAESVRCEQAGVSDERYSAARTREERRRCWPTRCCAARRGATALLRVTGTSADTGRSEVGLVATAFANVPVSPVVMRKLRPSWKEGGESKWELLVSATSVEQQVNTLDLASAQALFAMTLAVTVAGQEYLIESVASNEAFGQVYLFRLLLREARQQGV